MQSGRRQWVALGFLADVALFELGYFIAFWLRFPHRVPPQNLSPFLHVLPYSTLLTMGVFWAYEPYLYGWQRLRDCLTTVILAVTLANAGNMALTYWLRDFAIPRTVFLLAAVIQVVVLLSWRSLRQAIQVKTGGALKLVVVGEADVSTILDRVKENYGGPVRLVGAYKGDDDFEEAEDDLAQADAVYFAAADPSERQGKIMSWCLAHDKTIYLVPNTYDIMLQGAVKTHLGDQPLFYIEGLSLSPGQRLAKRAEDLLLAAILAAGAVVVTPFIALAIKLTSPGPVFYRQERVGRDGRRFYIYKFRTMVDGAERRTGAILASENDPRITPVGRFLRATRLDEVPQVLNVLKGEMSFVGPRPERPEFVERFMQAIPAYVYRFKVKPGITGLAQVRGNYSTEAADKLRYDLYYIRNWSLLLDLRIIFQTLWVVLRPDAASGLRGRAGGELVKAASNSGGQNWKSGPTGGQRALEPEQS
ncbi:MAG: sugar transferase [Bacillota bacterium]|nr:sugar transferase [Bacillota bacterium]